MGVQLRSGLWKLPRLPRAWTRLRSHSLGSARPHPLGKRSAFPTVAWTRFFEVQLRGPASTPPPGPSPPGLHLRWLDDHVSGYFSRWLDGGCAPRITARTSSRRAFMAASEAASRFSRKRGSVLDGRTL